jgi:hypothetical protein
VRRIKCPQGEEARRSYSRFSAPGASADRWSVARKAICRSCHAKTHPPRDPARCRPGRPKHGNYRPVPKQEGWRPYHPQSQLSITDILAIRASPITVADLARLYGVGQETIRDIRAGRRGRTSLSFSHHTMAFPEAEKKPDDHGPSSGRRRSGAPPEQRSGSSLAGYWSANLAVDHTSASNGWPLFADQIDAAAHGRMVGTNEQQFGLSKRLFGANRLRVLFHSFD